MYITVVVVDYCIIPSSSIEMINFIHDFFIMRCLFVIFFFFFQAEDGIRDHCVTGVQTCALPISELPGRFIVSSPFDLWRRGGLADPILRERFAKSFRQAAWRPGFLRTPQKKFPPGGEERTAARCQAAPLGHTRSAVHVLRAARALFLQGSGAARAPSNNWVDPPAYGGPPRRWPARVCRERP